MCLIRVLPGGRACAHDVAFARIFASVWCNTGRLHATKRSVSQHIEWGVQRTTTTIVDVS